MKLHIPRQADDPSTTIYFGKHKGKTIDQVDVKWIAWALGTIKWTDGRWLALRASLELRLQTMFRSDPKSLPFTLIIEPNPNSPLRPRLKRAE